MKARLNDCMAGKHFVVLNTSTILPFSAVVGGACVIFRDSDRVVGLLNGGRQGRSSRAAPPTGRGLRPSRAFLGNQAERPRCGPAAEGFCRASPAAPKGWFAARPTPPWPACLSWGQMWSSEDGRSLSR